MKTFYVDNFRGFVDTYIPIFDVNFFVGDNSTGKSSILALLTLLSRQSFWLAQSFNISEYEFGDYSGIANDSRQNESFIIGFYETDEDEEPKRAGSATLLEFCNVDNLPLIKSVYRIDKRGELKFVYEKNKRRLKKYTPPSKEKLDEEYLKSVFSNWLIELKNPNFSDFRQVTLRKFWYDRRESLYYVSQLFPSGAREYMKGYAPYFPVFTPFDSRDLSWVGPIRSKPKRIYEGYKIEYSPEGEHIPNIINQILSDKKDSKQFLEEIEFFGQSSKLFDSLQIQKLGRTKTSPFELRVIIDGKSRNINAVGYGVSQALPIIGEFFLRKPECWFAVQQPEVHLHPKAQAALGQVIYSLASRENKKFYIETHSDFLIDRFRIAMNKDQISTKHSFSSQVLFFVRKNDICSVTAIPIEKNGQYSESQPKEFREFFINEQFELISI